jgi:carbon starvation protein
MGFLAAARDFGSKITAGGTPQQIKEWSAQQLNFQIDVVVTAFFLIAVAVIFVGCAIEWVRLLSGSKQAQTKEAPYIRLDELPTSSVA